MRQGIRNQDESARRIANATFGIEIECHFPHEAAQANRLTGLRWKPRRGDNGYDLSYIEFEGESIGDWIAGTDSSLAYMGGYANIEFKSRILKGEAGLKSVVRFFKWLNSMGAKVTRSCGLHIHLGTAGFCRDLDHDMQIEWILRYMKYANLQKTAIFGQTGSAYRYFRGTYSRPAASHHIDAANDRARQNRVPCFGGKFFFINTQRSHNNPASRIATIETRAFAGTTNYLKVLNHLFTTFAIAQSANVLARNSWTGLNGGLGCDQALKATDNFFKLFSNHPSLMQFETFKNNKRKMFKTARKMAEKFQRVATRWAARGEIDINR